MSAPSGQRYVTVGIEVFGLRAGWLTGGQGARLVTGRRHILRHRSPHSQCAGHAEGQRGWQRAGATIRQGRRCREILIGAERHADLPDPLLPRDAGRADHDREPGVIGWHGDHVQGAPGGATARAGLAGNARSSSQAAGVLNAAAVPTSLALSATAAVISRARASVAGRTSLEGGSKLSSGSRGGLSAIASITGRAKSQATSAASVIARAALAAGATVRTATSGGMVGRVAMFGRVAMSAASRAIVPGTVVEMIARATCRENIGKHFGANLAVRQDRASDQDVDATGHAACVPCCRHQDDEHRPCRHCGQRCASNVRSGEDWHGRASDILGLR